MWGAELDTLNGFLAVKNRLTQAVKKATVDYLDVRFEHTDHTRIHFQKTELQSISSNESTGGIVRAHHKGGWGQVTFDSLNDLDHAISEACECAKLVGIATTTLADQPIIDEEVLADMKHDARHVSLDEKTTMLGAYNKLILENDDIESSDVPSGTRNTAGKSNLKKRGDFLLPNVTAPRRVAAVPFKR